MQHRWVAQTVLVSLALLGAGCGSGTSPEGSDSTGLPAVALGPDAASMQTLAPPLPERLESAGEDELIPVVVVLERQLSREARRKLLASVDEEDPVARKRERRKRVIGELQAIARQEQKPLLGLLDAQFAGDYRDAHPLWLSNAIGVRATKGVIQALAREEGVLRIHLDPPRDVKGGLPWGISRIGANQVWSMLPTGYDGTGVVVAVLDTGVQYDHPDLASHMWINASEDLDGDGALTPADINGIDDDKNGYRDDVLGFNFAGTKECHPEAPFTTDSRCNPMDLDGHGTHVAGTVAGVATSPVEYDHFGVAPGARIMALRESDTSGLSTQIECWEGMQYALVNGADIVNFSSGWLDKWSPAYETWRTNVEILMDVGVLFVTISHNDENVIGTPDDVRTPGRVPVAVTVGATDQSDDITWFSNHGPVTWQEVWPWYDYMWPPGLLKPDVVAPGFHIASVLKGSNWLTKTGTSFAAPHVAGVAALLLDENPGYDAYELKYILEESALELGDPGPDNVYGWGRVDALAAVKTSISSTPFDLSITGTDSSWTTSDVFVDNDDDGTPDAVLAAATNHLYGRVRNLGGGVVSQVELTFYVSQLASSGMGELDPDGDGDPSDGSFDYVGRYIVPTLGPKGSDHDTAVGAVPWPVPDLPGVQWCMAVAARAYPPNPAEADVSNNLAFSNQVEVPFDAGSVEVAIEPPPQTPDEPFSLEITTRDVPDAGGVAIVVDPEVAEGLMASAEGFERPDRLPDRMPGVSRAEPAPVRLDVVRSRAFIRDLVRAGGAPITVRILMDPPARGPRRNAVVSLATLDGSGARVGGLTVRFVTGRQRPLPWIDAKRGGGEGQAEAASSR